MEQFLQLMAAGLLHSNMDKAKALSFFTKKESAFNSNILILALQQLSHSEIFWRIYSNQQLNE